MPSLAYLDLGGNNFSGAGLLIQQDLLSVYQGSLHRDTCSTMNSL